MKRARRCSSDGFWLALGFPSGVEGVVEGLRVERRTLRRSGRWAREHAGNILGPSGLFFLFLVGVRVVIRIHLGCAKKDHYLGN